MTFENTLREEVRTYAGQNADEELRTLTRAMSAGADALALLRKLERRCMESCLNPPNVESGFCPGCGALTFRDDRNVEEGCNNVHESDCELKRLIG